MLFLKVPREKGISVGCNKLMQMAQIGCFASRSGRVGGFCHRAVLHWIFTRKEIFLGESIANVQELIYVET